MSETSDPYFDGRTRAPAARYAASETPGVRWHDTETGQEQFARPVGVDDLLDAGATVGDPEDDTTLISRIKIGPYQSDRWQVDISRLTLDPVERGGRVRFVGTRTYAGTEVFDTREQAVAYAEAECEAFADAEVRDAAAWYRERRAGREGENE